MTGLLGGVDREGRISITGDENSMTQQLNWVTLVQRCLALLDLEFDK